MIEKLLDGLIADDQQLVINLRTRSGLNRRQLHHPRGIGLAPPPRDMEINYPGGNTQDMKRFSTYLRTLGGLYLTANSCGLANLGANTLLPHGRYNHDETVGNT